EEWNTSEQDCGKSHKRLDEFLDAPQTTRTLSDAHVQFVHARVKANLSGSGGPIPIIPPDEQGQRVRLAAEVQRKVQSVTPEQVPDPEMLAKFRTFRLSLTQFTAFLLEDLDSLLYEVESSSPTY